MPPHGIINDEDRQEELPNDYATPFSPPSGVKDDADDTHPQADTNVDDHEHYDEGITGAIEVDQLPSQGILGYDPDKDQRKKKKS